MAVIAMPTGLDLPSPTFGVSMPISGTISMHIAMPIAPPMNKNLRPNRSTVHVALRVKMIPQVAFKALMRLMVFVDLKTFL
jgi:hypothetical protein